MTLKEELHALQHQNFDLVFSDPRWKARKGQSSQTDYATAVNAVCITASHYF